MKKKKSRTKSNITYEIFYAEPFIKNDFEAIGALLTELSPQKTLTPEVFVKATNENTVIVARLQNKQIVGMATLAHHSSYGGGGHWIEDVVTLKEYQGLGIGRGLMEKLIRVAEKTGVKNIKLTSNKKRLVARALYKKLGFDIREESDLFILNIK